MSVGLDELNRLTESIAARPSGSSAERRMAHRIAERLDDLGIPHTILHFRTIRGTATLYLVPFIGLVLSVLAALLFPLGGLIAATIFAVLAIMEATSRPTVSQLFRLDSSQNVIGLIVNRPPSGEQEPAKRRVVLTAHMDTPRRGWLDNPKLQPYLRALTILTLLSIIAIPLLLSVNLFVDGPAPELLAAIPGIVVLVALAALMQRDIAGIEEPGRNSNGSGIATVLAVAEELQRYPPLAVETLLVFTGASQSGMAGMTNFLAENQFNPESTYFVNLQSVGRGPVCFTRSEGPLLALESSPALLHITGDIALSHQERLMRPIDQRGMPTEQYAALIRGYQAISILGHPEDSAPPPSELEHDQVDPEALESAYLLTQGIIRRLDEEVVAMQTQESGSRIIHAEPS